MIRRTTLPLIFILILISVPYSVSYGQIADGTSKRTALTAHLGNNNGTFLQQQQQIWYVFNSTPGIGYTIQLQAASYIQAGVQVVDPSGKALFQQSFYQINPILKDNNGFLGQGTVYIVVYDFTNTGDYSLIITESPTGQSRFNPIEIGLGSTALTVNNTSDQSKSYLHFNSSITDYLSFSLNVVSSSVTINTTIEGPYQQYHHLYNSTNQEAIDFLSMSKDTVIILDYSATTVESFDITIMLSTKTAPVGFAPSNPINLQLGLQNQLNISESKSVFTHLTIPTNSWYNFNMNTNTLQANTIAITDETGKLIYSTITASTQIYEFFKADAGDLLISLVVNSPEKINLTIIQKEPAPGYDLLHAINIDSSHPATFTPISRTTYLNVTLDPTVSHLLDTDADTNISQYFSIYAKGYIQPQSLAMENQPIFLPKGFDFAVITLHYGYTNPVQHTVTLTDINDQKYSSQGSALSVNLDTLYSVSTNHSYQEVWVKFYAAKGTFYQVSRNSNLNPPTIIYYSEAGKQLNTGEQIIGGSDTYVYIRFITSQSSTLIFKVEKATPDTTLDYNFYSSNLRAGDYLVYTSKTYVNDQPFDSLSDYYYLSFDSIRIDIKQDSITPNQYEFLGNYFSTTFTDIPIDIYRWMFSNYELSSSNNNLLPVSTSGGHQYNASDILHQKYPNYNITEDSQYYHLEYKTIYPWDFSYFTTTFTYDKTNMYLVSSSSVRISNSTNTITKTEVKLSDYKISGPGVVNNSKPTTGEPPVRTNFETVPIFIGIITISLIIKKSSRYLEKFS